MNEQEQMTLKVFFNGIQSHIDEFKRYMKEDDKESISKNQVERFLNDVLYEINETKADIEILKDE